MSQPSQIKPKSKYQLVRVLAGTAVSLLIVNIILVSNNSSAVLFASILLIILGVYIALEASSIDLSALMTKRNTTVMASYLAGAILFMAAIGILIGLIIHLGVE